MTNQLNPAAPAAAYLTRKDKRMAKLITMLGPIDYYISPDPYRFLVEIIIGQMLSNKVAEVLSSRMANLCGDAYTPATVITLSIEQIRSIGIATAKAGYIHNLTQAIIDHELDLNKLKLMDDQKALQALMAIKGIGSWSAKMYLIFVLDRPDILPYEDMAFIQAYQWLYKTNDSTKAAITQRCRKWQPYRSYAARCLYQALDRGLTTEPFHLFR